jgi:hypothetical protein
MKRVLEMIAVVATMAIVVLTIPNQASGAEPQSYAFTYSATECVDYLSPGSGSPVGSYSVYGYENQNASIPSYIYCPVSFPLWLEVDGDSTYYLPGEDVNYGEGFEIDVTVLDTQTISNIKCRVFGNTGNDADSNSYFDYEYSSLQETSVAGTGLNMFYWQNLWNVFTDDVQYLMIACEVGRMRDTPGNQVVGYRLFVTV